jgi:hypothetical protein
LKNGKGRFSPLCFSDEYQVETWKDGSCTAATIQLESGGSVPFLLKIEKEKPKLGHGTCVSAVARRYILPSDSVRELIGFKFAVDPSFVIKVNGEAVRLLSLSRISTQTFEVDGHGTITVHRLDPLKQERTMRLKGIAWWVNRRMVSEVSSSGMNSRGIAAPSDCQQAGAAGNQSGNERPARRVWLGLLGRFGRLDGADFEGRDAHKTHQINRLL